MPIKCRGKMPCMECPSCGHIQTAPSSRCLPLFPVTVRQTCEKCGTRYREPTWYVCSRQVITLLALAAAVCLVTQRHNRLYGFLAAAVSLTGAVLLLRSLLPYAPFVIDTSASETTLHAALRPLRVLAETLQEYDVPGFRDYQDTPHLECPHCGYVQITLSSRLQFRHRRVLRETCQSCGTKYRNSTRYEFASFLFFILPLIVVFSLFSKSSFRLLLEIASAIALLAALILRRALLFLLTYLSPFVIDKD